MRNIEENVIKIVISASPVWPNNLAIQIINGICFLNRLVYRLPRPTGKYKLGYTK